MIACPNCGTENNDTSLFCKSCGYPLKTKSKSKNISALHEGVEELKKIRDLKKTIHDLKIIVDIRAEEMKTLHSSVEAIKNSLSSLERKYAGVENNQNILKNMMEREMHNFENGVKKKFNVLSSELKNEMRDEIKEIKNDTKETLLSKMEEMVNGEIFEMKSAFKIQRNETRRALEEALAKNSTDIENFKRKVKLAVNRKLRALSILDDFRKDLGSFDSKASENSKNISILKENVDQTSKALGNIKEAVSNVEKKVNGALKILDAERDYKNKIESLSSLVNGNQKNINDLKKYIDEALGSIKLSTSDNIKNSLAGMQKKIETTDAKIKELDVAVKKLENSPKTENNYSDIVPMVKKLNERVSALENKITDISTAISRAETPQIDAENIKNEILNELKPIIEKFAKSRKENLIGEGKAPASRVKHPKQALSEIKNKITESPPKKEFHNGGADEKPRSEFICRYCYQPFSSRELLEMHEMICSERPKKESSENDTEV